ncbi:MAG: hypothetical protein ACOXZY_00155 [Patescibacteria group bacterium]|jgi:hypothetical protein
MKKLKTKGFIIASLIVLFITVTPTLAIFESGPDLGLKYGAATGLGQVDPRVAAANIINIALGLLGIIAVAIIVYAGFKWMTSAGNEEAVKSAKSTLIAATIGLVIILSAYIIANFVILNIYEATR